MTRRDLSRREPRTPRARGETRPMRRNAAHRVETASFAQSGSKPRESPSRARMTDRARPLFPTARQATSCTASSVARPRTTTPASSTSWKKVRVARSRARSIDSTALPAAPSGTASARADAHRVAARARTPAKRATRLRDVALFTKPPFPAPDTPHPTLTDAHALLAPPAACFPPDPPPRPRRARFLLFTKKIRDRLPQPPELLPALR